MGDWSGAAGSIGAALIGGILNNRAVKKQNATNLQIARETNQMQLDAMRENNAFNKQAAIDMFNLESNYNSPYNQVQRLREAGLNPAVMMAGNTSSNTGNANASTPSASPVPALHSPTMMAEPSVMSGLFQNMESIAHVIESVSKSNLNSAQKTDIMSKLQPMIDNIQSETDKNKAQTAFQNVQTTLASIQANFATRKEALECAKLVSEIALNASEGKKAEADAGLAKMERLLKKNQNTLLLKQMPYLVSQAREGVNLLLQEQKTEQSKQASNYASAAASEASAGLARSQQRTEDEQREYVVQNAKWLANLTGEQVREKKIQNRKSIANYEVEVRQLIQNVYKTEAERKKVLSEFELAKKKNNWYGLEQILKNMAPLTGVAGAIMGALQYD